MENHQGNTLGKKIKALRFKFAQDKFVRKRDFSYTTLTKIEIGVIRKPSVFVMEKIAKALNITLDKIIK